MLSSLWAHPQKRRRVSSRCRGGWRQRLEGDSEAPNDREEHQEPSVSEFAAGPLQDWADGVTSAAKVAAHMERLVIDLSKAGQTPHPTIAKLAAVGQGPHAQAGFRDLFESCGLMGLQSPVPNPMMATTMLRPSSLIRTLHTCYHRHFVKNLGADTHKLREFWRSFLGKPSAR